MKTNKLYTLGLFTISIIIFVIGYFSVSYLIKISTNKLLEIQIESSKREAQEFSKFTAFQIQSGVHKETIIKNIQKSIEGTNTESGFMCLFSESGVEICHPDPRKIGKQTNPNQSYVLSINGDPNPEDFYNLLRKKKESGGVRNFNNNRSSEIIYLYPVENTNWIFASHANIQKIEKHINQIKFAFLVIYLLTSVIIILLSFFTINYLGNYYENELEARNNKLVDEVLSLAKLNSNLTLHKNKVDQKFKAENWTANDDGTEETKIKNRLLTYSRDKLITINTKEISFINTELSITSIMCLDGKKYNSNLSLDELFTSLDPVLFFRANRQNIVSVKGIHEILKYGNNQLKIKTNPSNESLIISKNKASDFKKWLDM